MRKGALWLEAGMRVPGARAQDGSEIQMHKGQGRWGEERSGCEGRPRQRLDKGEERAWECGGGTAERSQKRQAKPMGRRKGDWGGWGGGG